MKKVIEREHLMCYINIICFVIMFIEGLKWVIFKLICLTLKQKKKNPYKWMTGVEIYGRLIKI